MHHINYREDGRDSMKFYTDPGYFFELWYAEIQKDIEQKRTELRKKKRHVSVDICLCIFLSYGAITKNHTIKN